MGKAIRTTTPIRQAFDPALLVTMENLVASLAGDSELPAQFRHWLTR
jgi:hypothetical protein